MPTIAQKLCRDIVDPTFTPSSSNAIKKPTTKSVNRLSSQKCIDKTTEKALNDKNKIITNSRPFPVHPNDIIHCKSRDTLLKERRLPARKPINTLVSGSTKCDNCITLVQKQEPTCKCARKQLNNVSAKQIQTLNAGNYLNTDNAYTQCTETTSSVIQLLNASSFLKSKPRHNSCVSTETRPQQSQCQSTFRPSVSVKSKRVYETPTIILKKRECSFKPQSIEEKSRNCSKKGECPFKSEPNNEESKNHAENKEFHVRHELKIDKSTDCSEEKEFVLKPETIFGISKYPEKRELSFNIEKVNKIFRNNLEKREFPFRCMNKPWAISNYPKRGPDF